MIKIIVTRMMAMVSRTAMILMIFMIMIIIVILSAVMNDDSERILQANLNLDLVDIAGVTDALKMVVFLQIIASKGDI